MNGFLGREWVILQDQIHPPEDLVDRFGPFIAQILANRNTDGRVFDLALKNIPHYRHIPNIEEAASVILDAVKKGRRIIIYGDYDVDGITGTALLYHFLKSVGAKVLCSLPTRKTGYGLNKNIIRDFERYADLIITVDNGTTAVEEINGCRKPVVVLDHHNIGDKLPKAILVNPKLDTNTPNYIKEISSVGLAFYVALLLNKELPINFDIRNYLHLVAVGTLADIMPLNMLNRVLVAKGIEVLNHIRNADTPFQGMKLLLNHVKNHNEEISSKDVVFSIVPRLNTPGRIENPITSLRLLLESNETKARQILEEIEDLNDKRRELVDKEYVNVLKIAELKKNESLISVFINDPSKVGILGIIAGRLSNEFEKPSIVFCVGNDVAVGSARSVKGVDLYSGLKELSDMFIKWGGHTGAAGLTIPKENLERFEIRAREVFSKLYKKPQLLIDMRLETKKINQDILNQIKSLEPFGEGFPEPVFLSEHLNLSKDERSNIRKVIFKGDGNLTFVSWDTRLNSKLVQLSRYSGRVVYSIDLRYRHSLKIIDMEKWL